MDLEMGGILIRTMIKQDDDRKGQLWPLRQIISDLGEWDQESGCSGSI